MGINYYRLVRIYEQKSEDEATQIVKDAFREKDIGPREFDLGKLFVECFGWREFVRVKNGELVHNVMEAAGAVATTAFQNISGQIVYNAIMEKYMDEDFVLKNLIPEVRTEFPQGEKIAGISRIGDEILERGETDPYTLAGVRDDFIETPPMKDRGMIVPISREAITADRTGVLLDRCGEVGYWFGLNDEKRAIDAFIDENRTVHRYKWRGNTIATYGDNTGLHTWDNLNAGAGTALVDWTDIDAAEQTFNAITDPNTGEPTTWEPKHLVVTKQNEQTARRIISATEIRVATPGYATTGNPTQTIVGNPYANKFTLVTSRLLGARLSVDTNWFLADVSKVCKRMVHWPMEVREAPANSHDEFHRQIVRQFRVNGMNEYVVVEPRAVVKSEGLA